jgi:hypothetical protein
MRYSGVVIVFMVVLISVGQAHARAKPEAPDAAARKACATGDFRRGIELLADLYLRTDDATYVYNQGRCYEQNHQWVSAIDRFREYLRKGKDLSAGVTAEVEKHIADCKLLIAEEAARSAHRLNCKHSLRRNRNRGQSRT